MGFYHANNFSSKDDIQRTDEIALNPDYFFLPDKEVLQTLAHEMVHLWQHHFGDPSIRTFHNTQWANMMEHVGLMPSDTGEPGGKRVGQKMGDYIIPGGVFDHVADRLLKEKTIVQWKSGQREVVKQAVITEARKPGEPFVLENVQDIPANAALMVDSTFYTITSIDADTGQVMAAPLKDDKEHDKNAAVQILEIKEKKRNKIKYSCPECGANVWGKPELHVICGECEVNFDEVG